MTPDGLIRSYVLAERREDQVFYVSYGSATLTRDVKEARRYAREASANSALRRLQRNVKLNPHALKVEVLDE